MNIIQLTFYIVFSIFFVAAVFIAQHDKKITNLTINR